MSTKTTFKRIALVAVSALGLGVLSVAPSSAAQVTNSDFLTVSATSATVTVGETASVTITNGFINGAATDSSSVVVTQQSGTSSTMTLGLYITDSANAYINAGPTKATGAITKGDGVVRYYDYEGASGTANGTNVTSFLSAATTDGLPGAVGTSTNVTMTLRFMAPTTAGTFVFRIYQNIGTNGTGGTPSAAITPSTFTLTVAADAGLTTSATYTKTYLNRATEYSSIPTAGGAGTLAFNTVNGSVATNALKADSALVVSAGLAASPTKVAILWGEVRNGSDTKVVSAATQTRLLDSITVVLSGPGFLATSPTGLPGGTAAEGTKAKQVTINSLDSVIVYSDGTPGTATITSYKGSSIAVANVLASPKTITFTGRAITFTPTVSSLILSGSNLGFGGQSTTVSTGTNDSATAGTSIITFIAKDSASNAVTDAALSVLPGMSTGAFYAVSSDTRVVRATNSTTSQFLTCSYSTSKWVCSGNVIDSGTVTLTIQDSTTGTAPYSATAVSLTVAGSGYTGTIALDKTTYNVGEKALITMTSKDSAGRTVGNGTSSPFGNVAWASNAPVFGIDSSANSAGGRMASGGLLTDYLTAGGSFISGTDTVMVFMPTVAGTYTLNGTTGNATTPASILTFTVVDPVATATKTAVDAAKDASDAATDAALEATDAAYAATDAANIAAEAADAATAAAEAATEAANAAKESADAATAAVEELATSVAKLMAALQAQITTLAKVVAKIAVKVKA